MGLDGASCSFTEGLRRNGAAEERRLQGGDAAEEGGDDGLRVYSLVVEFLNVTLAGLMERMRVAALGVVG